jgi:Na+-translocating ferredoxin:NAD+ oxidoreductase RnfG subunit
MGTGICAKIVGIIIQAAEQRHVNRSVSVRKQSTVEARKSGGKFQSFFGSSSG